jgi:hypothetical protein
MADKCHFSKFLINLLSICLNHIIAHETYHYCLDLPLKLAPTCFTKQRGTSKTQEFECEYFFVLVIYRWKGLENTFPTVYYTPTNVLNLHLKNEKEKFVVV